mmetsp:Transcript_28655/g.62726  ORF Transcript_28655/g.62726 Transcript_28655/m.62726 type:complete len:493 (-) Transcript_28655:3756-5234(-)
MSGSTVRLSPPSSMADCVSPEASSSPVTGTSLLSGWARRSTNCRKSQWMQTYRTRALRASWVARLRIRWAVHTAPGSAPQASSAPLPPQSPHSRALLALFARRGRPCRWHAPLAPTQAPSTSRRKRSAPSAQREATAAQDPQSPRSARRAHMQPTRAWMSVKVVLPAPSNQSVGRVSANHARMVTTVTPELRCLYPAQQAHTEGTPTAAALTTVLNVRLVTTATARARPRRRAQQEGTATSLGSSARSAVALALQATSAEKAPSPRLTPAARPAQTTPHPVAPALPLACHAARAPTRPPTAPRIVSPATLERSKVRSGRRLVTSAPSAATVRGVPHSLCCVRQAGSETRQGSQTAHARALARPATTARRARKSQRAARALRAPPTRSTALRARRAACLVQSAKQPTPARPRHAHRAAQAPTRHRRDVGSACLVLGKLLPRRARRSATYARRVTTSSTKTRRQKTPAKRVQREQYALLARSCPPSFSKQDTGD